MKILVVTYLNEIDNTFLEMVESMGVCDYLLNSKVMAHDSDGRHWGDRYNRGTDSVLIAFLDAERAEVFYQKMVEFRGAEEVRKAMRVFMLPVEKYVCDTKE